MALTGQIERKYMAHYVDASFGGVSNYVRLGKDLEEFNIELNPDVEVNKNILGEQSVKNNGYEVSADVEPYYAVVGDPLFEKLQEIIDKRSTGDACKTTVVEAHLWDGSESDGFKAYKEDAYLIPSSHGGDTSGYQIPFTIYYAGNRTEGTFNVGTKTFS